MAKTVILVISRGREAPIRIFSLKPPACFVFGGKGAQGMVVEEITKWKHSTTVPAFAVTNISESYSKCCPSLWKYLAQKNKHTLYHGS